MTTTPNLDLPLILPGQAQKHITHNEALAALDLVAQLVVLDRQLAAPPATLPAEGLRYIVPPGATGSWAGKDNQIAAVVDGVWSFVSPQAGWLAYCLAESGLVAFSGTRWAPVIPPVTPQTTAPHFGVNTTADAANRFAVKADAVLLAGDDLPGGSGDIRVKLNRALLASTASLLFQTGWSGRAEIGQIGDDRLRMKVSPNGTTWYDALAVEPGNGNVGFGTSWPQTRVEITRNPGPLPAPLAHSLLRLLAADGVETRLQLDAVAAPASTAYRRANGTVRLPEALNAGDWIGGPAAWGYGATGFSSAPRAAVRFLATERWTDTAQGTALAFFTTPSGSLTSAERLRILSNGNIGIGTSSLSDRLGIVDEGGAPFRMVEYSSSDGAVLRLVRARGTAAAPAAILAGDRLAGLSAYGHDGTATSPSRTEFNSYAEEAFTPAAQGTSLRFSTTALGSTQLHERLRIAPDGSLIHRGNAQTIVDVSSHLRLRPYPTGSLPPVTGPGTMIYVTGAPNNRGLALSDGTSWRYADGTLAV